MAITALNSAASGLMANQLRHDVSANNVANVNTDGFRASTVRTADAAYDAGGIGQGTRVSGVSTPDRPGPVAPSPAAAGGMVEQSNTDLASETTASVGTTMAYTANAIMARTADQLLGTLLDVTA